MAGPIIKNMGLFWKKDLVDWQKGKLLGTKMHAKKKGAVDFADQVGVYALYSADYRLVYVGQAGSGEGGSLGKRLKWHTRDHLAGRWDKFSWFGLRLVIKKGLGQRFTIMPKVTWEMLIRVLEGVILEIAEPPQNSQGGRLAQVEQYLQEPGVDPEETSRAIKDVYDLVRELAARPPKTDKSAKAPKSKNVHVPEHPRLSQVKAAILVLAGSKKPMKMTNIVAAIQGRKLWAPKPGRKSSLAMYYTFNHDKHSRFRKTEDGLWELTKAGKAQADAVKKAFKEEE